MPFSIHVKRLLFPCIFPSFSPFPPPVFPLLPTRLIKISEQTKKSLKNLHFRFIFCNFVGFLRARMRRTINNAYTRTPINMTTIALDSSTDVCSAALLQDGKVIAERCNLTGSNHAALLPVYVQELLASLSTSASSCSNEAKPALDAIVLSEGPGSYTGLRIAASLAKGLCYGLEIPLLAVPTLAAIAHAALNVQHATLNTQHPTLICPMIDARRMEVYCTVYDTNLRVVQPLAAKVIDEQSFADLLADHDIYFCGNGADKCRSVISHPHAHWIDGILPTGTAAGQLAHAYRNNTELVRTVAGKDIAYFEPNYLKEFVAAPSHVKGLTAH